MADRRRYTGTKTLQLVWTGFAALAVALAVTVRPGLLSPTVAVGGAGAWVLGLLGLGWSERRHWRRLVATSSFESAPGTDTADLQQIRHGRTVSVEVDVPGLLSQAHTTVRATVEGVDASFTVHISAAEATTDSSQDVTTGDGTFDDVFHVEGSPENVRVLLTADVRAAVLDAETPGTFTVTGREVVYEVPFTRLTPAELDAASEAVSVLAARIETAGKN